MVVVLYSRHSTDEIHAGKEIDSSGSGFTSAVHLMADAISVVEAVLDYQFRDRTLVVEALTHNSHPSAAREGSYQRLEFLGDSVLGCAISNHLFLTHPSAGPGLLTSLRSANVNNEQLARVAVRHKLFPLLRRCKSSPLDALVRDFTAAVAAEEGGPDAPAGNGVDTVRAPKVLADLVESIIGAVFTDCGFNLERTWAAAHEMLKPIITEDNLFDHPMSALTGLCQKNGKAVEFVYNCEDGINIFNVFVDGKLLGEATSAERKSLAKFKAAADALSKLWEDLGKRGNMNSREGDDILLVSNWEDERQAKSKLHEICLKNQWPEPIYEVVSEEGPSHDRRFRCSVQVVTSQRTLFTHGNIMPRLKEAKNSAACNLLHEFGVIV